MYIVVFSFVFFFFKQKTAYEMRIRDWSSDVCSSDLFEVTHRRIGGAFMGVDLAEPIGGLLAEERAVGMVLGAVGAGEPSKIIGFSLGQEGGGQDRGG